MNKAEELLNSNKTVSERASKYAERISKSLEMSIIDTIKEKVESIDDQIFDLENFSLETDINKGVNPLTKEQIQIRFESIINLSYKRDLLKAELASKQKAFDTYFKEEEKELPF